MITSTENDITDSLTKNRKHKIKFDFFDNIDSQEKAYVYGYFLTKGSINKKNYEIKISAREENKDIVEKISNLFYDKNIANIQTDKNGKDSYVIYIRHPNIKEKLISLGLKPDKIESGEFPTWLNKNLYSHFIRGIFDGTGCLSLGDNKSVLDFTSTLHIVTALKNILKENFDFEPTILHPHKERNSNTRAIQICGFNKTNIILKWLYNDASIYLERKYNDYQTLITNNIK